MKKKILSVLITILALCMCMFTLTACGEPPHTHTYDQQVVSDAFKATNATCTSKAAYYYSCTCGEKGAETFESGEPLGHSFTNYEFNDDAKCGIDGTETALCDNGCGESDTRTKEGTALEHDYGAWISNNDGTKTSTCECGDSIVAVDETILIVKDNVVTGLTTYGKTLSSIVIPNSVTSIGSSVFSGCSSLESITLPFVGTKAGVTSSDTYQYPFGYIFGTSSYTGSYSAKQYYHGLSTSTTTYSTYYIPSSLKSVTITGGNILYGAFYNCSSLTSIDIPNSVTSIDNSAFSGCRSLTSIDIPNSVTSIGNSAFFGCRSLTSIDIPNSVTSIGEDAFYNCTSLTSIEIPNSVTSIGYKAFSGCSSLTSVVIGDSVTSIGFSAFEYCTSLTSVNYLGTIDSWVQIEFGDYTSNPLYYAKKLYINDELVTQANITTATKINAFAFYDCTSLTSIVIGDSVTSIGTNAFYNCDSLTSILVDENNVSYKSTDGNLYSKDGKILIRYAPGKKDTVFTIPNSVTSIGEEAFLGCSSLTSIVIPDSVTSIGNRAFYNCSSLQSITLPFIGETKDGTTNTHFGYIFGAIDDNYNYNYVPTSLKIVVITGGERIDSCAFSNCSSLTSIVIPDSVTSIGNYAFSGCSSLTSIDIIPNSVTSIGEGAFSGCSSLTYNIKDGLKYLGNNNNKYLYLADVESDSITSATIDNNCRVIGSSAFRYCDSLTSIVIPDSVTSIGEDAFRYCDSLTSVEIPNSVTSIGDYAFGYCSSLTSIKYRGTQSQWQAITKGSWWDWYTGNYTITYNYQGE